MQNMKISEIIPKPWHWRLLSYNVLQEHTGHLTFPLKNGSGRSETDATAPEYLSNLHFFDQSEQSIQQCCGVRSVKAGSCPVVFTCGVFWLAGWTRYELSSASLYGSEGSGSYHSGWGPWLFIPCEMQSRTQRLATGHSILTLSHSQHEEKKTSDYYSKASITSQHGHLRAN